MRVLSKDGALWGAGVLVTLGEMGAHVLTCAHVVMDAMGNPSSGSLVVDLPGRDWFAHASPVPDAWSPVPPLAHTEAGTATADHADFAVLALDAGHPRLPGGCGPLPLAACGPPDDRRVAVIGYPQGAPAGLIATARLAGTGGPCPDWVQLDGLRATGGTVTHGFSGAAVWDPVSARVIGLVTAAYTDRAARVAWMLPTESAVRIWPPLTAAVRRPRPRPHTPPSVDELYELADALLDVPQIAHDSGRLLRESLPPAIRHNIRDNPWPRQQLLAVVQACTDHRDGCCALRGATLQLGGESVSVALAVGILDRICCVGEVGSRGGA
ncbi:MULTISPECIES: trypsin-like peptidase domain-containing protein [unclassified Streptomyces]|uniref:effector-associated domain 2-containing protein n=1 Tax=unclassified Streptomyces TaxID=2593676 RepID=UPI00225C1C36|nr:MULTISPECIES: trypsin-like peptidase domain-containing protein [unclassified Streptomyces]MCX4987872.1 serine protease [Streptomyces sp. NBC_00568]MCX5006996.1 serine protease [Streptomyces sp. NBC_00638]